MYCSIAFYLFPVLDFIILTILDRSVLILSISKGFPIGLNIRASTKSYIFLTAIQGVITESRGVVPLLSGWFGVAPAFNKDKRIFSWQKKAAAWTGVEPSLSAWLRSTPAWISNSTISSCPNIDAICSAEAPCPCRLGSF